MWFCTHFKDEETEAQGDAVSCLGQPVYRAPSLNEMFPVFVILPSGPLKKAVFHQEAQSWGGVESRAVVGTSPLLSASSPTFVPAGLPG